ncbi:hypothetical protein HPB47_001803 [Ixodes persulcatus]|uniref:Uncharacterized protein n=1 Tax=Ixodes persulcatus TaxID=34615 RepID=A0AC60PPF6_IXOPE|nr:hypothetical protein HPB47_001803 [Ixodes persulcatus]
MAEDCQEAHLIFDIPQDEIAVSSSITRITVTSAHPVPNVSLYRRSSQSTDVVEDETVTVRRPPAEPPDQRAPGRNGTVGGTSVKAITFLLISVACVLLISSMVITDLNNRNGRSSNNVQNIADDGIATPLLIGEEPAVSAEAPPGKAQNIPLESRNFFARRPLNSARNARRSLRKLLRGSKCTSKACIEQGAKLLEDLEPTIRPCDDFYQHVCARWQHRQPSSGQNDGLSVDSILLDLFSDLLISVIRADAPPFPELKFFFDECVQPQPNLFRNVRETLLRHLEFKGWPYPEDATITDFELSARVGRTFSELGLETLLSLSRGPNGLQIGQPRNLLLRHFLPTEPQLPGRSLSKAYDSILETLPMPSKITFQSHSTTNVTAVEIQLRKILNWDQELQDAGRLKNCTTRQVMNLPKAGYLDVRKFLEIATSGASKLGETVDICLSSPEYLDRMRTLPVSKQDLLNYVAFRVILELSPLLSNWSVRSDLASIAYSRYAEFAEKLSPAQICVRFLERYDPFLPTYLTSHRALELLGGADVIRIILDTLKKTFLNEFNNATSFTSIFRQKASDQLSEVYWEALMPYWLSEKKAAELFAEGIYTNNPRHPVPHFFYFWLRTSALKRRQFLVSNKTTWTGGFLRTWATLSPPYRHLEIPLPVFDFVMSNDSSVSHLHVPRVGPRLFRELYRLLYHEAINFDLSKVSADESRYLDAVRLCLEKQYKELSFNPSRVPLNSAKTSLSDLLDLLSVRTAFAAYLQHLSAHDGDYRLGTAPNLSGQQLFFIYYARSMCEKLNPRFMVKQMTHGPVSPAWFRVNGPLRNMQDFSLAFGCSPGTNMNPMPKCI